MKILRKKDKMEYKNLDKKEMVIVKIKKIVKWIWNECKDWHSHILDKL